MDISHALKRLRRATPWSSPPDCPWRDAHLAVVDIETTGLDLHRDEIISVGVVHIRDARITTDTFYAVAKPGRPTTEAAICLHSLTQEELRDAPPFSEVMPLLRGELRGAVIVAHAAWVERAFLNRALRPFGERVPNRLIDTAALARAVGRASVGPNEPSLEGLSVQMGLPVHTPHHALGDALTTAQLLLALASEAERKLGSVTVHDLWNLSLRHGN